MMEKTDPQSHPYLHGLTASVAAQTSQLLAPVLAGDKLWLLVGLAEQTISLMQGANTHIARWPISSARLGSGNLLDSEQTPLGLHQILEKIGAGLPAGAVLKGRVPTGEIVTRAASEDLNTPANITARILRLGGMNPGYNQGENEAGECVDSYRRYIYIHGTDRRFQPGQLTSQGCITLSDKDMIDLFEQVSERTLVLIACRLTEQR